MKSRDLALVQRQKEEYGGEWKEGHGRGWNAGDWGWGGGGGGRQGGTIHRRWWLSLHRNSEPEVEGNLCRRPRPRKFVFVPSLRDRSIGAP